MKIKEISTFTTDVFMRLPGDDRDSQFRAEFNYLDEEEASKVRDDLECKRLSESGFLDKVLVRVSCIGDENGDLPPEKQMQWVRGNRAAINAVGVAFWREIGGASEKNLSRSRGR